MVTLRGDNQTIPPLKDGEVLIYWDGPQAAGLSTLVRDYMSEGVSKKINNVVAFYRPEDVSDPTKTNTLGPRFRALDGKVEAFVTALTEIAEIVRAAVAEAS